MKKILLSLGLCFALSGVAQAKTPPEVLKPYKAYHAALKSGDKKAAIDNAQKAWKHSEKLLGSEKITGDLAFNYATAPHGVFEKDKTYKNIEKAFLRSIELSKFYNDYAIDVEIQRRLKFIEFTLTQVVWRDRKMVPKARREDFFRLEKLIYSNQKNGSTYEAELETLRAQYYQMRGENEKSLIHADKALEIFDKADDGLPSVYPHVVKLVRGQSLDSLDEKYLLPCNINKLCRI